MKFFAEFYRQLRHLLGMDSMKHPESKRGRGDDFHHD